MSKKSKRKNNLKLSILLLLLLLMVLIASTYAWFTANQTVTVDAVNVHIEAQNGLQISTDASKWKSKIDNDDIKTGAYTGNTNQMPTDVEPVSTVGEIDTATGFMKMFYGTVASDENAGGIDKLTAVQDIEQQGTQGKFVAFDMFLRVNAETKLKMTGGSKVVKTDDSADNGIKQASRVAFCVEGNAPAGTELNAITSLKGAKSFLDTGSTVYIWDPNPNWHTNAAVAHARDNYQVTTTTGGLETDIVEYYGIKKEIQTGIALKDTYKADENFAKITPTYKTISNAEGIMNETPIFTLAAGITKVRVYMWVEGQDIDCENTASGTDIAFNLQLQVAE